MSSISRRMAKRANKPGRARSKRLEAAEAKAFRFLEDRWSEELGGREIPEAHRRLMRADPAFRVLVKQALTGAIVAPDLDTTDIEHQRPDGKVESLFLEEMAGDPRRFLCRDCGTEPVETEGGRCTDCETLYPED